MAIWNLGSINIDHVYRMEHLPLAGETLAANSYSVGLGGKGANQSIAAALAGATTQHLGAMSEADEWVVRRLQAAGVGTDNIQRQSDNVTGHAIILLDSAGENSIIIHPGANRAVEIASLERALRPITREDTLLMQNETNCQIAAASFAQNAGARVIYSAAPFELGALRDVMPHVSILAMNAGEADQLFATLSGDLPVQGLLITRGAEGAEYHDLDNNQVYRQPAFPVAPIDTTAAGDTFAGYFAASLDRGDTISDALRLASAAAALKVTRAGAGDAIPSLDEVRDFMSDQPVA